MNKLNLPQTVLVIGSGPVNIGQAAEFDYAGSQACLSLRDEGIRVVLLNSNPATIQTDYSVADRIYIEPMTPEIVETIIQNENVEALLPSMGGQTALNLVIELRRRDILQKNGVRILGTSVESIELSENREAFHRLMQEIGMKVASSWTLVEEDYVDKIRNMPDSGFVIRTSFSLGGSGGKIAQSREELIEYCREFFSVDPHSELDVEQSLLGLIELEYEMMRDSAGNCISVCNMENLDPMGVHTGESIVVTPSMTLNDKQYHMLRSAAIEVISALGIIGACNIQFALDPLNDSFYIVEVNPRTSRSSALASKSSGYPIARVSTKLSLGYLLQEVKNPITDSTFAASEPSLDYITVKIPRWPFDKFELSRDIGVQMKSIGEVMGIGRTFEEALMKAIASLETKEANTIRLHVSDKELERLLTIPNDLRIFSIFEAYFRGWPLSAVKNMTGFSDFFLDCIKGLTKMMKRLKIGDIPDDLVEYKKAGISDALLSQFIKVPEKTLTGYRLEKGIVPVYRSIDTCSGEFDAVTPYLYSTYGEAGDQWVTPQKEKIIIIGSGPNRISQGLEFDYGSVKAVERIRELGYEAIMINSNPETVSTDFDVSDRLYFEPVTFEHVSNIINAETPKGVIIQFSGQTGQNMCLDLEDIFGNKIFLGTQPEDIFRIEDRGTFALTLKKLEISQPEFYEIYNENDSELIVSKLSLPVIVRSSFIIGGRAMDIIYNREDALGMIREAFRQRPGFPVLVSKYVEDATEMDVDFVSDGKDVRICGIAVHVEEAGTHSGDATMVVGPEVVDAGTIDKIEGILSRLCDEFSLRGLSNLQIMKKGDDISVIELNARASRSVPFISKAYGLDFISMAVDAMLGLPIDHSASFLNPNSYAVKIPVFPFSRFSELDIFLNPEMKSTGEGMALGTTFEESFGKALMLYYQVPLDIRNVLMTVGDEDKAVSLNIARMLKEKAVTIYATPGTANFLVEHGINTNTVYKLEDMREPRVDSLILEDRIDMIINTPGKRNRHKRDGFTIRKMALSKRIPVMTNLRFAETAIRYSGNELCYVCRELESYHSDKNMASDHAA